MKKVVLLIDDDNSLALFLRICIEETGDLMDVRQAFTADEALEYLKNTGIYSDVSKNPRPSLIMLDLGLPKISGIEFLKQLKTDATLSYIPVVILTAMESPTNIIDAYCNYANSCLIKPFGFDKTKELMKSVTRYWGTLNKLPEVNFIK